MKDVGLLAVEVEQSDVMLSGQGKAGWLLHLDSAYLNSPNLHVNIIIIPVRSHIPKSMLNLPSLPQHSLCTHSPGSLVVEEKDKEELFSCLCLPLLPQLQHIHGGDWDGDSIVEQTLARHLGIDYLVTQGKDI